MPWIAAAMAAGQMATGVMAQKAQQKGIKQQREQLQAQFDRLDSIGMPPDLSARVIMEQMQQQGTLTPELEQEIQLQGSAFEQMKQDPSLRQAQTGALNRLEDLSRTGMGAEERSVLNQTRNQIATDTEGKRQQIMKQMQAQGMGGSGASLIAQLQGAQAGSQQSSMEGDRLAAMASNRALDALDRSAGLAGNIDSADLTRGSAVSGAKDRFNIERFNAANSRQQRNIGSQNVALEQNLKEKQRLADSNTMMENVERQRMNEAKRNYWQDKLQYANAYAPTGTQMGQTYRDSGKATAEMWSGIGNSIGTAGGAMSGMGGGAGGAAGAVKK
jgi:hypothetical protein